MTKLESRRSGIYEQGRADERARVVRWLDHVKVCAMTQPSRLQAKKELIEALGILQENIKNEAHNRMLPEE